MVILLYRDYYTNGVCLKTEKGVSIFWLQQYTYDDFIAVQLYMLNNCKCTD